MYPTEDDVGEEMIQRLICELMRPLLGRFLRERRVRAFVGADQFIYWRQFEPTTCVSPDVYVMPGVDPDLAGVKSWKVWETGIVPSFALEVVADDRRKDYERSPERHADLGTGELVVFDPHSHEGRDRVRWQVYRRVAGRRLRSVEHTDEDRVISRALRCQLRAVGTGGAMRIRVGTGRGGDTLFPTEAELARTASLEARQARTRVAEAQAREAEARARAERAEAELVRLRARLERG